MRVEEKTTILVTGANGGLGKETIRHLLSDGVDHVVMACRSQEKGEKAAKDILSSTGADPSALTVVSGFDMLAPEALKDAVDALPADLCFSAVFLQAGGVFFYF